MPWRETCRMDEKLGFVLAWHRGEGPMTALCAAYGISRKTGYKWLGRYREGGMAGRQRPRLQTRLWGCAARTRSGVRGSFARF